jgi:predicted nucleic acid-binding protein
MDLLIAGVCLYHEVTIVTFDNHFQQISEVSPLKIALLNQEGPA